MATEKTAIVTFFEAYETPVYGGFKGIVIPNIIPNIVGGNHPRIEFKFTTVDELVDLAKAKAEALADVSGHGYSLGFHIPRGARKPPGFDAKTRNVHVRLSPEPSR